MPTRSTGSLQQQQLAYIAGLEGFIPPFVFTKMSDDDTIENKSRNMVYVQIYFAEEYMKIQVSIGTQVFSTNQGSQLIDVLDS